MSAPPPDEVGKKTGSLAKGADLEPLDDKTKALMALMGGTELLIANAAFQVVSGILSAFRSPTETSILKDVRQKDLLPGLSMFVCVIENKFHTSDFFSNETIVQNFFIFDCRMSVSRAADIAKFDRVSGLIKQRLDLEAQAEEFSSAVGKMSIASYKAKQPDLKEAVKAYKDDFALYESCIIELNNRIDETGKMIDKLKGEKADAGARLLQAKRREVLTMTP